MIFVYHDKNKVVAIESEHLNSISFDSKLDIATILSGLAQQFEHQKIIWCHSHYKEVLNKERLVKLFHHDKLVLSYRPDSSNYFGTEIGYVEETLFVNANKKVCFPTWQMSSAVGMIHAKVLNAVQTLVPFDSNFDFYLSSLAKLGMPHGLLCYSEPGLLKQIPVQYNLKKASFTVVFKFVKQHYKIQWVFLLLFNLIIYERKFPILPFLFSFFYKNRTRIPFDFEKILVQSSNKVVDKNTIDVIIPTIGRKQYLYDVLQDLAKQTHLPEKVFIVEQNLVENSLSELDYLETQDWPFAIKHIFTHQAGACNARNLALAEVTSEWVFLADDDIRFENNFFEKAIARAVQYGVSVFTTSCLQANEIQQYKTIHQSGIFGSGNSFVQKSALVNIRFDKALEFGYGEDTDFGLQLRNQGQDVIYFPELKITHLKAPMGGFRIKMKKQWESQAIQPKPSPTIMVYKLKHLTIQQLLGYKTVLFFKFYAKQTIKNPFKYYHNFQKQWEQSLVWANRLKRD